MDNFKFNCKLSSPLSTIQLFSPSLSSSLSVSYQVRFILICLITNTLVFWLNCATVLADFNQNKRPSARTVTTKYGSLRGVHVNLIHNLQPIEVFLGELKSFQAIDQQLGREDELILTNVLESSNMFKGIPYASPPTGKLRFMPPVTPAHWSGTRMADKFGHVCPQNLPNITNEAESLRRMTRDRLTHLKRIIPMLQNQSEDCLYLNIYTPECI